MNVLGLSITRQKKAQSALSSVDSRGGWWPIIRESFAGAWQRNIEVRTDDVLAFAAVYACVTLIASDIAKLRIKLVQLGSDGIWTETESPAFSPVLKKPNRFQTRIKFIQQWMISKLVHGNTYVLKERDKRGVVVAMYVLDPHRVKPMVAPDGSVFYQLSRDDLSGLSDAPMVPASEIIHDMMDTLFHPLVGVSPIYACGLPATQGLNIQRHSTRFFANLAQPGGVLTSPGTIQPETAKRLQEQWMSQYSGDNAGRVAVLGDGLDWKAMTVNAVDAELIAQLKLSAENACSAYHVPAYMVNVGPTPPYNNVEALNQMYYGQTLQNPIECIESLLDEGLELPKPYGTEFELDDLLRMDTASKVKAAADAIGSGGMSPNEARLRYFDLGPVRGGESPFLQQQNYSLEALSKRDAKADPFGMDQPTALPSPEPDDDLSDDAAEKELQHLWHKDMAFVTA